jgi:phospholipid/cholesterol/gamma-HCH transport system permease protein
VNLIGKMLVVTVIRELIPLLMAVIIIARSGTAIASELGLMKVNGEFMALTSMGIDTIYSIAASRIFAFTVSLIVITVIAAFVAITTGAMAIFILQKVAFYDYFDAFFLNINITDIILFFLKAAGFGFFISSVCCFFGLSVKKSVTEIPQVSTKAVMNSFFYVFLLNVMFDFMVSVWQ